MTVASLARVAHIRSCGRSTRRSAAVVALAATAAAVVGLAVTLLVVGQGERARFEVLDQRAGTVAYDRTVRVGDTFELEHVHSVTRRPVVEVFSVSEPDTIAMEEMRFDTFGANLPAGPETVDGSTTTFEKVDGGYRVRHHGRPLGSVPLLVGGEEVDHRLTFEDGESLRLLDVTDAGTPVALRVRHDD